MYLRLFFFLQLFLLFTGKAQLFWYEDFGNGCSAGSSANLSSPTPTNGAWSVTSLTVPYSNGSTPNEWFISATEQGQLPGNCNGLLCGGSNNRSLHIGGNSLVPLNVDVGTSYLSAASNITNKRVESPPINCSGFSGIQLHFYYIAKGVVGSDYCNVLYSSNGGATWNPLVTLAPTPSGACAIGQVEWGYIAVPLPASVNNVPNVKIAFQWLNNDPTGSSVSVAIDDVGLSVLTINSQSVVACPQQTVLAQKTSTPFGINSYTWTASPNSVTFSPLNSPTTTITYGSAGIYTISLLGSIGPGPYSVKASRVDTVNITIPLIASPPTTICIGSSATMTTSGASSYTWWANTTASPSIGNASLIIVSPTITTNYLIIGAQGSCISNTLICQVSVSNSVSLSASSSNTILCRGQSATITAIGANTYSWSNGGNASSIIVTPTTSSIYTVIGFNGACSDTLTYVQTVADCTVIDEVNANELSSVFPNPFGNELFFKANGETEIKLVNIKGEVVKEMKLRADSRINTSDLAKGIYFLNIRNAEGERNLKLVKE